MSSRRTWAPRLRLDDNRKRDVGGRDRTGKRDDLYVSGHGGQWGGRRFGVELFERRHTGDRSGLADSRVASAAMPCDHELGAPASNGGSAVTNYVVTGYSGGNVVGSLTVDATVTNVTVTSLANGTTYTFRVAARNGAGTGAQSADSNAVTPRGFVTTRSNRPRPARCRRSKA